jgi:hypothetical protein
VISSEFEQRLSGRAYLLHSNASKPTGAMSHLDPYLLAVRRKLSFIPALMGLAAMPLLSVPAFGAQEGDFVYQTNGAGAVITAYAGSGGAVVIPDTLGGLPVTTIGYRAFSGLTHSATVTIPNQAIVIGWQAFFGCTGLQSVTIPSSVSNIGTEAFAGCSNLTNVIIEAGMSVIPDSAFAYCSSLKSFTIPNSVTSIGSAAFRGCSSLTSVAIPNGVTELSHFLFAGCSNLVNVTTPESVISIRADAFNSCGLTNITISAGLINIDGGAFAGCQQVNAIEVSALNPVYNSVDGVLFNKAGTALLAYPAGKIGPYTISGAVTSIGELAFSSCALLRSLVIPNNVTNIGWGAFAGCVGLTNLTLPSNLTRIEESMFGGCTGLTSINIPNSVTFIEWYAFEKCGLKSITIPASITNIQQGLFSGCANLTNVVIPATITYLAEDVFSGCTSLRSLTIPNGITVLRSAVFSGCSALENVALPENLVHIDENAFFGCTGLTTITIPSTVSTININGFGGCPNLAGMYFEGNPPHYDIEQGIFSGSPLVKVFRRSGATGWGSTFAERPTAIWIARPSYADWAVSSGLSAQFPAASGEGKDADSDGFTNKDEWMAGTDPTKKDSRLGCELAARPGDLIPSDKTPVPAGQRAVYVRSVPGRYYGVQRATDLSGGWMLQDVRTASTTQTRFVVPADGPVGFYRVVVLP